MACSTFTVLNFQSFWLLKFTLEKVGKYIILYWGVIIFLPSYIITIIIRITTIQSSWLRCFQLELLTTKKAPPSSTGKKTDCLVKQGKVTENTFQNRTSLNIEKSARFGTNLLNNGKEAAFSRDQDGYPVQCISKFRLCLVSIFAILIVVAEND
jgi:hypothetical protein